MGGSVSKVLEPLGGKPVLLYSFETLAASPWVKELCVVCREEDSQQVQALLSGKQTACVRGARRQGAPGIGAQRGDRFRPGNGIPAYSRWSQALCHPGHDRRGLPGRLDCGAATAAVPSKDTCKLSDGQGFVESTPPGSG